MDGLCRSGRRLMLWLCMERKLCLGQLRSACSARFDARCTKLPAGYWRCSGCRSPAPSGAAPTWPRGLDVSGRTVRNGIERLRELDYPVEAVRGSGGHYRLGVGAKLPPLLLDEDILGAAARAAEEDS
jgi:HTH domain